MSLLQMMMAGLSLEYEGVITSGDMHIATKDGEAMFFHDSIDFSPYAGTDGGSTPYRLVFTDSAGKTAIAYGGAAGGGETLGSELIANGDFETLGSGGYDLFSEWTEDDGGGTIEYETVSVHGGSNAVKFTGANLIVKPRIYKYISTSIGRLYKFSGYSRGDGTHSGRYSASGIAVVLSTGVTDTTYALFTVSITAPVTSSLVFVAGPQTTGGVAYFDDLTFKAYTDIPATGLHLMSAKNGTTRNMASVESGFDPNTIVGVKIYG